MSDNPFGETTWRKALEARGKDWVMAELRRRPGRPQDVVYDIVFEQPYPTREFCEQWCIEQDNKLFHVSWQLFVMIGLAAVAVVCGFFGAAGIISPRVPAPALPMPSREAQAGSTGNAGNTASSTIYSTPQEGTSSQSGTSSGAASGSSMSAYGAASGSSGPAHLPSVCDYQTYQTAECKTQPAE
jgi:hypothetical protein